MLKIAFSNETFVYVLRIEIRLYVMMENSAIGFM
jgi:hypothetical protein